MLEGRRPLLNLTGSWDCRAVHVIAGAQLDLTYNVWTQFVGPELAGTSRAVQVLARQNRKPGACPPAVAGTCLLLAGCLFMTMPEEISRYQCATYGYVGCGYVSVFCRSPCPRRCRPVNPATDS